MKIKYPVLSLVMWETWLSPAVQQRCDMFTSRKHAAEIGSVSSTSILKVPPSLLATLLFGTQLRIALC